MVVTGVLDSAWTTVPLSETYVSPIAVCTAKYETGITVLPALVRMQNVGPASFDIRLQNPKGNALPLARDVHCVVVEEGSWNMPDGRKIEANKYLSTITDRKNSWVGQQQTYANSYTTPVVLGQVMSYNDPTWSVFWCRGKNKSTPPNSNVLFTGKHVGEDRTITRLAETVGYIVIEEGHATSGGIEVETARGPDITRGYVQGIYTYDFVAPFSTTPAVAVVSQVAMDGNDGGWGILAGNPTTTSMQIAVDEDQVANTERNHATEELDYVVFSAAGSVQLRILAA